MFTDEDTGDAIYEMSLADLIQQPGFKLDKPRLTLDFSKPVVKERIKSSFSGGNPSNQIVVFRLSNLLLSNTDAVLEKIIKQWLDATIQSNQRVDSRQAKEKLLSCLSAILNKFKKLLAMMANYPNKKDNVLKEMVAESLP